VPQLDPSPQWYGFLPAGDRVRGLRLASAELVFGKERCQDDITRKLDLIRTLDFLGPH